MKTLSFKSAPKTAGAVLVLSVGLALSGCGGMPTNRSLNSVNQPVVERTNYTLDISTGAGGLSYPEQSRLDGWFTAMNLRYGDRISIDDPMKSSATLAAIEALASRHGLTVSDEAPVTPGYVEAGTTRVIITRSTASVPGCPNWSSNSDTNLGNATSSNYGCAINSNLAAMVADPEHLIKGAESTGNTVVMSSSKAIQTYRGKELTGAGGLKKTSTKEK